MYGIFINENQGFVVMDDIFKVILGDQNKTQEVSERDKN